MIVPLSWLKEYINTTLSPKELGEKLTEMGLGCEKILKQNTDTVFELEITPNRPDWLSIVGVAREVAAIENKKIKYPVLKTDLKPKKGAKMLPFKIHPDFSASQRMTGIIIDGVTVKESPKWLKDKLMSIGQRPINNIVDITNFVMFELGNPIHSFDYHKIKNAEMWVKLSKGGEEFESVDEIKYRLPKNAIIYEDSEKIFDLAGIKGGRNSGTYSETKAVFILVAVDDPVLIRRASQALALRSEASSIFERNVNRGGTIDALKRTTDLILELAGGEIASELTDLKKQAFDPWKLELRLERLEYVLGIKIPEKKVTDFLERLNLNPKIISHPERSEGSSRKKKDSSTASQNDIIICTIPTYRNDLKIEEDLIEEVARMYGYNNFPKTMIEGASPSQQIPYFLNYRIFEKVKNYFAACGFSEAYTYSLISENDIESIGFKSEECIRVDNPVSREFEYLRPTLKANLIKALKQNPYKTTKIDLFELGKVYKGKSIDKAKESYALSGISNHLDYSHIKGVLEKLFDDMGIGDDPAKYIEILDEGIFFELNFSELLEKPKKEKIFKPIPKYPSITEDIKFWTGSALPIGEFINEIKKQSNIISKVEFIDQYKNSVTFRIVYQDLNKNLTNEDVSVIREKINKAVNKKFSAKIE